jgi:hypothetical protein
MSIRKACGFQRLCQAKTVVRCNQIKKTAFARPLSFQIGFERKGPSPLQPASNEYACAGNGNFALPQLHITNINDNRYTLRCNNQASIRNRRPDKHLAV